MLKNPSELKYWRKVWKSARRIQIDMSGENWCNYWHQHFDWDSRGNRSRFEHRKHLRPLMFAFSKLHKDLENQERKYQLFVLIHEKDTGSDALYVHTENPHSDFPIPFEQRTFVNVLPPLLMGLVSLDRHQVSVKKYEDDVSYTIFPKT